MFVSQNGVYGFKIFPPAKADERRPTNEWMGDLFSVQPNGSLKSVWTKRIVNIPMEVRLSDDGHVVTLDTYANLGYAHSIVVYGKEGQVLGDYALEQILSRSDIANHVDKTVSSRWWRNGAEYEFISKDIFVIKLQWGKRVEVNLETGKIAYK